MVVKRNDIMWDVAELVQAFEHHPATEADTILDELTASSLSSMPTAQHAGITVASPDGSVRSVSTTDGYPVLLDKIQERHREGPCLEAAAEHQFVRVNDVGQERRWPNYCRDVLEHTPIRSVLAFQLFAANGTTGALNFHAEQPHAFDDDAVELGLILATHTALVWHMVRRDAQFRSALASRDIIGQAKGMVMERFDIDAVQAFELLKRLSQNSNTPLIDVARRLVSREGR
ncbi:GAF and ANTAR domain-containing protein [Mycobacterium sp. pUA109]|uniref:GAF and ANTAR domain-containing protein n=1 Tax=Mycobacterium sp. pUA109 TaxID=3238982 RepID=UPI00351BCDAC